MLNHNPQAKVLWHCKDKELSIVTEQNVTHGGQVFNNYGPKS